MQTDLPRAICLLRKPAGADPGPARFPDDPLATSPTGERAVTVQMQKRLGGYAPPFKAITGQQVAQQMSDILVEAGDAGPFAVEIIWDGAYGVAYAVATPRPEAYDVTAATAPVLVPRIHAAAILST